MDASPAFSKNPQCQKEKGEYYCWRNVCSIVHICKPVTKHQSVYYAVKKKKKQEDVLRDKHHRLKEGGEGEGGGGNNTKQCRYAYLTIYQTI